MSVHRHDSPGLVSTQRSVRAAQCLTHRTRSHMAADDHIVPPHDGVPADAAPCNVGLKNASTGATTCQINQTAFCAGAENLTACREYAAAHKKCPESYDDVSASGECLPFDFNRLGLRSTALLLSPWVKEGGVFQQLKGPSSTSQFEHSSIAATLKNLYNLSDFLTVSAKGRTERRTPSNLLEELSLIFLQELSQIPAHGPCCYRVLLSGAEGESCMPATPGLAHCMSCCLTRRGPSMLRCRCTSRNRRRLSLPGAPAQTTPRRLDGVWLPQSAQDI